MVSYELVTALIISVLDIWRPSELYRIIYINKHYKNKYINIKIKLICLNGKMCV